MKRIYIDSHGSKINGYLFVPSSWCSPQKLPCVIIAPGGEGIINMIEKKENIVPSAIDGLLDLARSLQYSGFIVMAYDGRGMGGYHEQLPRSEGERTNHDINLEDVEAVLDFLETIECIDKNRIGAFGQSVGGAAIAFQAAKDERLKSLVLWGTPPSYTTCVNEGIIDLKKKGLDPNCELMDIEKTLLYLHQPVMLAGGSEDKKYFRLDKQKKNFDELIKSKIVSLILFKDFKHRIDACYPGFQALTSILVGWFKSTL